MTILERAIEKAGETDTETGCTNTLNKEAFELCRQNYYLKQQNQILQDKQSEVKNENIEEIGTTTQTQEAGNSATIGATVNGIRPSLLYALTIVATIIVTVVITKYLTKRKQKL